VSRPLSVVIAAHNAEDTLGEQLDALTRQDWPFGGEIIVADNGSTDRTAAFAQSYDHPIIDIRTVDASAHTRSREASTTARQWGAVSNSPA